MSKSELVDSGLSLEEQYLVRVDKVKRMLAGGVQAWPQVKPVDHTAQQVLAAFTEDNHAQYQIAGRIISLRWHGKTAFANIQDRSGKIQVY